MKRVPLFFVAGLLILLGLGVHTFRQVQSYNTDLLAKKILLKEKQIRIYSALASKIVASGQLNELDLLLKEARKNDMFDWALLTFNGDPAFVDPEDVREWKLTQTPGEVKVNEFTTYLTTDLGGGLILTLGVSKGADEFLKKRFIDDWRVVVQDLTIPTAIALLVFLYFLKDILKLVRTLMRPNSRTSMEFLKNLNPSTKEASVLIAGFRGFNEEIDKLTTDRSILFKQVLPSMRNELFSGRNPPYDFHATLVRLDINKFSELFQKCDRTLLLGCINALFEKVTMLVSRHGGFVHEFVGDEVLFYFKGEGKVSVPLALWCLRDIDEYVNTDFIEIAQMSIGQKLLFKASFATGELHFGPLVDGFSLAGSILIESVRVLSQVQGREQNSVVFDDRHLAFVPNDYSSSSLMTANLKGMGIQSHIYQITQMPKYSSRHRGQFKLDKDLLESIRELRIEGHKLSDSDFTEELRKLTSGPLYPCAEDLQREVVSWLKQAVESSKELHQSEPKLASLVLFLKSFHFFEEQQGAIGEVFQKSLYDHGARFTANAIEVLAQQDSYDFEALLEKLYENSEPRVVANAVVLASGRMKSEAWLKVLSKMIHSKVAGHRASGLFAIGEIFNQWVTKNPVLLRTTLDFRQMIEDLPRFLKDRDPKVQAQARQVLEKTGRSSFGSMAS